VSPTAVESGTDSGGLSRLRSTVSAVFDGKGERLGPDRSHMGERIWSVGDRPSDEENQPRVKLPYSIEKSSFISTNIALVFEIMVVC
jgi:hypothetical protein